MFLSLQVSNTYNHELKSAEKSSLHILHSSLWRLRSTDEASLIETSTNIIQMCDEDFLSKPTLVNHYVVLKNSILEIRKVISEEVASEEQQREKIVIGIACDDATSIIKTAIEKFKKMRSKEKIAEIDRISDVHPYLEDFEKGKYKYVPHYIVRALFERLICKISMHSDVGFIDLNGAEMLHEKMIVKDMVEEAYKQSGIKKMLREAPNNRSFLHYVGKNDDRISEAFSKTQAQRHPLLTTALIDNKLVHDHYVMSQVIVAAGVH